MPDEEHGQFMNGHEGHDVGDGAWGVLGLLVFLAVAAFLLARDEQVRARALTALAMLRRQPAVAAVLRWMTPGRPRPAGPTSAEAPERTVRRPDLSAVVLHPAPVRELLMRVDELTTDLEIPRIEGTWPDGVLAEHRLDTLRTNLVDLVETLGRIPADVAVRTDASGSSPLEEAVATAELLEQEALLLRSEVYESLAHRLRQQRLFVAGKYQGPRSGSALDL